MCYTHLKFKRILTKRNGLALILGFLFLSSSDLFILAQEIDSLQARDSISSYLLEEVAVTANRFETLLFQTPEAIESLNYKIIQDFQSRTSPEALMLSPGVFVQKTNQGGGSPFLRGLTGNQTLLLVDGIRLSNATMRYGPNQYLNTIDVLGLEKFEVLRGSGSVQYGSDAVGGTIQAFSHELDTSLQQVLSGTLLARLTTHGMEQSLRGRVKHTTKRLAFSAGITVRNFGDIVGGDTTGTQAPSGYHELDLDLKARLLVSPKSDLTIAYQNVNQRNVPVYHKVVLEDFEVNKMDPQHRELAYVRLKQKFQAGMLRSAVFTASLQGTEEGRELRKNDSSTLRTEKDKVRSSGFSAEAHTSNGLNWNAITGLEVYHDLVNSTRTDTDLSTDSAFAKRGLYPDGSTMTSMAAFTVHTLNWHSWSLSAGARFNSFIIKVNDEILGQTKLTPSALVGKLALLRKLNRSSNVFVSMNSGFRAPNVDDLGTLGIVDFRYETPNYDLKPEYSIQYQTGFKYQGSRLKGEAYLYRNELYQLIVRSRMEGDSIEGYPVYQKENNERAYIQGFETSWEYSPDQSWKVGASLTYTYGQNTTKDEPLRRIPPLFGRLSVEYQLKGWWMNLEWQAAWKQDRLSAGDRDDNRIPAGGTPAWNIININASYTIQCFQVDLGLRNLFDQDYRYHGSGINGYGRSANLSLIIHI